jgi:hypothetical protein
MIMVPREIAKRRRDAREGRTSGTTERSSIPPS